MKFIRSHGPLLRAVGVLSAVGILVTGVTFAALQSQQAVLSGSTIQSATADLRIGISNAEFSANHEGFTFQDVVPGGPAMPADGHKFYLKNFGAATLDLKLVMGSTPAVTGDVDLSKVKLQLTRLDTGAVQTESLQALQDSGLLLTDVIEPNTAVQYNLRAVMDADAFDGTGAGVGGIDLVFSGTAQVAE